MFVLVDFCGISQAGIGFTYMHHTHNFSKIKVAIVGELNTVNFAPKEFNMRPLPVTSHIKYHFINLVLLV